MRILQLKDQIELIELMRGINVDPYGIRIMVPKAMNYVIRVDFLSCVAANILKQEMLSLGGDVALPRGCLTGKLKKTDCFLLGNLSQCNRLKEKLKRQPFGLGKMAAELSGLLYNYQKKSFSLNFGRYKINVKPGLTRIIGILNLTPDSFSGDGLYSSPACPHQSRRTGRCRLPVENTILERVKTMINDGADIIDIGGESSRPKAAAVSLKEELARVIPSIKTLAKKVNVPISVDTYKSEVARQALDNGASIVNDITALNGDPKMIKIVKKYKAGLVLMHMKGNPKTMQNEPRYSSLFDEIIEYLGKSLRKAQDAGINPESIIIDPGIGFGKTCGHNLTILKSLKELKVLGRPILVGTSRKSFIGKITDTAVNERLPGTIASCVIAVKNGADFLRVHDIKQVKQALKLTDAVSNACVPAPLAGSRQMRGLDRQGS